MKIFNNEDLIGMVITSIMGVARPVTRILSREGAHIQKLCTNFSQERAHLSTRNFSKKLSYVSTCFQYFTHICRQKYEILVSFNFIVTIIESPAAPIGTAGEKNVNIDHFCAFSVVCLFFCLVVFSYLQLKNFRFSSHQARALRPCAPPWRRACG